MTRVEIVTRDGYKYAYTRAALTFSPSDTMFVVKEFLPNSVVNTHLFPAINVARASEMPPK